MGQPEQDWGGLGVKGKVYGPRCGAYRYESKIVLIRGDIRVIR